MHVANCWRPVGGVAVLHTPQLYACMRTPLPATRVRCAHGPALASTGGAQLRSDAVERCAIAADSHDSVEYLLQCRQQPVGCESKKTELRQPPTTTHVRTDRHHRTGNDRRGND